MTTTTRPAPTVTVPLEFLGGRPGRVVVSVSGDGGYIGTIYRGDRVFATTIRLASVDEVIRAGRRQAARN